MLLDERRLPVSAKGYGGRHYRFDCVDQNFDSYSVEYTFADGTKLMLEGRYMPGCEGDFASYAHGAKGTALISKDGHFPAHCRTFRGQNFDKNQTIWHIGHNEPNLYQVEWNDLTEAIRQDRPYNEVKRGVEASLVTAMGRMSCHTGQPSPSTTCSTASTSSPPTSTSSSRCTRPRRS